MATERYTLFEDVDVTQAGVSRVIDVRFVDHLSVFLDWTSGGGDFPTYLQASPDGVRWIDVPFAKVLDSSGAATDLTAVTDQRNIDTGKTGTTEKFIAIYDVAPFTKARIAWNVGTNTKNLSVRVVGK